MIIRFITKSGEWLIRSSPVIYSFLFCRLSHDTRVLVFLHVYT